MGRPMCLHTLSLVLCRRLIRAPNNISHPADPKPFSVKIACSRAYFRAFAGVKGVHTSSDDGGSSIDHMYGPVFQGWIAYARAPEGPEVRFMLWNTSNFTRCVNYVSLKLLKPPTTTWVCRSQQEKGRCQEGQVLSQEGQGFNQEGRR